MPSKEVIMTFKRNFFQVIWIDLTNLHFPIT